MNKLAKYEILLGLMLFYNCNNKADPTCKNSVQHQVSDTNDLLNVQFKNKVDSFSLQGEWILEKTIDVFNKRHLPSVKTNLMISSDSSVTKKVSDKIVYHDTITRVDGFLFVLRNRKHISINWTKESPGNLVTIESEYEGVIEYYKRAGPIQ